MSLKKKMLNSLLFVVLSTSFASCSSVISLIADHDKCMYPGCTARAKRGEVHCAMHDLKPINKNLDKALDKARRPYTR